MKLGHATEHQNRKAGSACDRQHLTSQTSLQLKTFVRSPQKKIDLVQRLSLFPDSGFAVQIAALQSIEEITKLAERIGIETPLIAETKLEGASWFVLVLDLYEQFESAQAASKNLQRAYPFLNEPWVRPVKSLKKSLAKFSG